ncbi:MAG: hypothetical protein ACXWIU_06345, partial [Limisphaerales bacterium]
MKCHTADRRFPNARKPLLKKLFSPRARTRNAVPEDTSFLALMVFERDERLVVRRKHYEKNT